MPIQRVNTRRFLRQPWSGGKGYLIRDLEDIQLNLNQILNAVLGPSAQIAGITHVTAYSDVGTFSFVPQPITQSVILSLTGGGGAGAGVASAGAGKTTIGAGGTGAGYGLFYITGVTLAPACIVKIGAGGIGGASGSNDGGLGGDSMFIIPDGREIIAYGGYGGQSTAAATPPSIVEGLNGYGGDIFASDPFVVLASRLGDEAGVGFSMGTQSTVGSRGGDSFYGSGAPSSNLTGANASKNGVQALGYGSGGSGAICNESGSDASGGNGSPGRAFIFELSR